MPVSPQPPPPQHAPRRRARARDADEAAVAPDRRPINRGRGAASTLRFCLLEGPAISLRVLRDRATAEVAGVAAERFSPPGRRCGWGADDGDAPRAARELPALKFSHGELGHRLDGRWGRPSRAAAARADVRARLDPRRSTARVRGGGGLEAPEPAGAGRRGIHAAVGTTDGLRLPRARTRAARLLPAATVAGAGRDGSAPGAALAASGSTPTIRRGAPLSSPRLLTLGTATPHAGD